MNMKDIFKMGDRKRYLTAQEVAELWELNASTVRDLAEAEIIPGTKVGIRKWQFLRTTIERLGAGKADLPLERYNRENTTAIFIFFKSNAPTGLSDAVWNDIRHLLEEQEYENFISDYEVSHSDPDRPLRNRGIINTAGSANRKRFRFD
jgi:excisionase family DNA binding protein